MVGCARAGVLAVHLEAEDVLSCRIVTWFEIILFCLLGRRGTTWIIMLANCQQRCAQQKKGENHFIIHWHCCGNTRWQGQQMCQSSLFVYLNKYMTKHDLNYVQLYSSNGCSRLVLVGNLNLLLTRFLFFLYF